MWKCSACAELVDDDFEVCWKCQQPKPPSPTRVSAARQPSAEWVSNFRESKQPDGTFEVEAFGHRLTCGVCGNTTFRERTTLLNTALLTFFKMDWANRSATNFVCSRCGYIFWFLPQ